jgi:drug/metabolite transporter (DMT)-like permease
VTGVRPVAKTGALAASQPMRGHLAMLCFSAVVAGSFSLGAMMANDIAPAAFNAIRFFIAAMVIGGLGVATGSIDRTVARAPWRYVILGALFCVFFVLMYEGLKTATPVSIAAMFTLTPVISALFGWMLLRQITTVRMAAALMVGGVGAVWVIFRADLQAVLGFRIGHGEAVFFWGVVAHSVYTPLSRLLNRGENVLTVTFGMLVAACLLLTAFGWQEIRATDWGGLPPMVWITLAYTSLLAGSGTFTLLQYAAMRLPSAKVMAYTYLTPSWVILWEIALGHGAPSGLVLAGVALTIVALWMLLKEEMQRPAKHA